MVKKGYFRRGKQRSDGHFQRYWYVFSRRFKNPDVSRVSEDRVRSISPSDLGRGFENLPPDLISRFSDQFVDEQFDVLRDSGYPEKDIIALRNRFVKDSIERIPKLQLADIIEQHEGEQRGKAVLSPATVKLRSGMEERAKKLRALGAEVVPGEKKGLIRKESDFRKRLHEVEKLEAEARGRIEALRSLKELGIMDEVLKKDLMRKEIQISPERIGEVEEGKKPRRVVRLPALLEKLKEIED